MKKTYYICVLLAILIVLALVLHTINAEAFEEIDLGIVSKEGLDSFCVYSDENEILFAIEGNETELGENDFGRKVVTKGFVRYDLQNKKIIGIYPIGMNVLSNRAIPYNEGLIYIEYAEEEYLQWEVHYLDKNEHLLITKGTCEGRNQLPRLTTLEDKPVIVWIDADKEMSGVSSLEGLNVTNIVTSTEDWIVNTDLSSNSTELCFVVKGESKFAELAVIGIDGLVKQFRLDGKITSFAIVESQLICGLTDWEEKGSYYISLYDYKKGETSRITVNHPLYRMCGGPGNAAICVDASYNIYKINSGKNTLEKVNGVDGLSFHPVVFSKTDDNKWLFSYLVDNKYSYYVMD